MRPLDKVPAPAGGGGSPGGSILVDIYPDPESLAIAAAALTVRAARRAMKARGRFAVALSGGTTPRRAYEFLGRPPFTSLMPWSSTHVLWSDERCVDPADPRSNERMAREVLLDRVPIPADQVYPVRCVGGGSGIESAEAARSTAVDYDAVLRMFFPLDLIFLGLGEDGHTASLFPGSAVLGESQQWAAASLGPVSTATGATGLESGTTGDSGGEGLWRVTLTAPFINAASLVVFLVSGAAKAAAVAQALEGEADADQAPARLIRPKKGRLQWLLDDEAARLLATTAGRRLS